MGKQTPTELRRKVRNALVGKRTKDVFIFLFFVLICFIFWFVQQLEESFSKEVSVPVQLVDVPEGVIITTDVPEEIKLTIHDKGIEILPYMLFGKKLDTLRISFKTYGSTDPVGHAALLPNQLQKSLKELLPTNASILSMSPDTVFFYYNRGLHRRMPLKAAGSITAKEQYCITGYGFSPDSVDVYAPLSILDTMKAVYTTKLELDDLNKTSEIRVGMRTQRGMRVMPDSATLKVGVDVMTRQTIEVPIVGINFPAEKALRTFPSSVKVSYLASAGQSKKLDASEFVVIVTYADLEGNTTNRCRPHINYIPEGVTGVLIDPIEVDYLLENVTPEDTDTPTKSTKKKRTNAKKTTRR